ncbi:hypothetical protein JCM8547_005710 [Rhodosporidiobolus lusitaniae]
MASQQQPKGPAVPRKVIKKGLFAKDLPSMMYGFGDDNPAPDTVSMMEELVIEHITDVCMQAHRISTNRGKIKVDDFRFALRRDPKKLARLDELLFMQEEIARARRGFEDPMEFAGDDEDEGKVAPPAGGNAVSAPAGLSGGGGLALPGGAKAGGGDGKAKKKDKGKQKA